MQDNFLTKISHEVRTPINAIIGLGFLFQQTRLEDQQRKYLTTIIDSAQNLLETFQSILDYTTTEEGALALNILPFEIETLVENVRNTTELRCQEKGLTFTLTKADNVPSSLMGDSIRISQTLRNIVNNAVKFTHTGDVKIHIDMADSQKTVLRFRVTDTGIGIPEEYKEDIFTPFMQVDNSHTRNYGGPGLGLATCMQLVKAMEGTIQVAPNTANPSGGSIFTVTLPLAPAPEKVIVKETPLTGKKILVMDFDPLRKQVINSSMLSLGLETTTCDDPEKAMEMLSTADDIDNPYSFIAMAWQMPTQDSLETSKYITEMSLKHPHPMMVLYSNYELDDMQQTAEEAGFFAFVQTPTSTEALSDILHDALKKQQEIIAASAAEAEVSEEEEGPVHILLVEDNEINQEIAYEVLISADYTVDIANNGQEAVDAVEAKKYNLILMDIQMPVLDGLEATRRIRTAGHKMPIIAMTAHGMADDKETSLSAGMNAHLTKPLEPMALFSTISSLLPSTITSTKKEAPAEKVEHVRREKLPDHLAGFNLTNGLATVAGNESLYIGLLRKFADRYATINDDISACLKNNKIQDAVRHAHTIRGIAANLGAEELASAAETLEKAIVQSPAMTTPLLRTLVVRLTEAVTAIHTHLGSSSSAVDTQASLTIEQCLNRAERADAALRLINAITHMEQDWGHATEIVEYLTTRLRQTEVEHDLQILKQSIEDFEVAKAQELASKIHKILNI